MSDHNYKQVYIQNLPYDVTEDDLRDWCLTFGEVERCRLMHDKQGYSRGFAFVTFAFVDGYNRILSGGPHCCGGRRLVCRPSNGPQTEDEYRLRRSDYPPVEEYIPPKAESASNDSFVVSGTDPNGFYNDGNYDDLSSLQDDQEANLEMLRIQHEREIAELEEKIALEKRNLEEAQKLYKIAEEECKQANDAYLEKRANLIKNVLQTFNLRREFARQKKSLSNSN